MPKLSNLFGGSQPMPNIVGPSVPVATPGPINGPTYEPGIGQPTYGPINGQPTAEPVIGEPISTGPDDIAEPTGAPAAEPVSGHSGGSGNPSTEEPTTEPGAEPISGGSGTPSAEEPTAAPIADPNCPPGYKPVIIYVPDDMPTSELPALPVGPDGHVVPPSQDGPQNPDIVVPPAGIAEPQEPRPLFDPNKVPDPNTLPWINPDLYNSEANPHIGIVPSDQEIPGSIGHVDLPENAIIVPDESTGWWHSAIEKFQNIPLVEKIQDYINEKRASLAVDGVDVSNPSLQQDGMNLD